MHLYVEQQEHIDKETDMKMIRTRYVTSGTSTIGLFAVSLFWAVTLGYIPSGWLVGSIPLGILAHGSEVRRIHE